MILKNCSLHEFMDTIGTKKCIVMGAGVALDNILKGYPILKEKIECVVDNYKKGQTYTFQDKQFTICSADYFEEETDYENKVILIATSKYFDEVINQLDEKQCLSKVDCYVGFFMKSTIKMRDHFKIKEEVFNQTGENKIPKIIHCFWFSKEPKPELQQKCLNSWKKYCPDYQIMEWNTDNYDIYKNKFVAQAYEKRKWAFMSDYARLDVLYEYGGIYLDLDVEMIKNYDQLLKQEVFVGFDCAYNIELGSGIGARKGHPLIKMLLDSYEDADFINEDGTINDTPQPARLAPIFEAYGLVRDGSMQKINNVVFFPTDYFSPLDFCFYYLQKTENTFSIHHFDDAWHSKKQAEEKIRLRECARAFYRRIYGLK